MPMATTRATGRDPNPVEDEFLHLLYRGGELLAAGKVIEAKDHLERAHKMQPKNEKGQNLLGLTYFKLGLFDRAAELYEMLVRDNPVDPTLRVNLGLVYLKTNALQRAVREFEVAVDLAPDHKKAHNYLGVALAQQGEYGRAREHFLLSGSEAMAEKMTRAIAGEGYSRPPPPVQPAKARGFAEIEGTEVVREKGGEPVAEPPPPAGSELDIEVVEEAPTQEAAPATPPPPPAAAATPPPPPAAAATPPPPPAAAATPPPAAEDDWGAQFGFEESPSQPEATAQEQAASSPAQEYMSPEAAMAPGSESAAPEAASESSEFGAEGPVMAAYRAAAPEVPANGVQESFAEVDSDLPVLPIEEVSEDGMPVLTAEPENPEDLAAIAQHQQAPPEAPSEVETAFAETSEALMASVPATGYETGYEASPAGDAAGTVGAAAPMDAAGTAEAAASVEPVAPMGESSPSVEAAPSAEGAPSMEAAPQAEAEPQAGPQAVQQPASGVHFADTLLTQGVARTDTGQGTGAVPLLGEMALAVALGAAPAESPFAVGPDGFSARVEGELLTRLEGLVAISGQISFKPEMKRFRGRTTDKPFGDGAARVVRASGRGVLFLEPAERRTFLAVDLGDESAYLRDEHVFAFEEPVMFENGRVPSDIAPDLDLVHLRGNGKVLLSLAGPLRSVSVQPDAAVTVPLTHLVGWLGNLTPRVIPLLAGPGGEVLKTAVELSGEGFALISLPVR
jgi:uncharacterized protein (AIM24 family)